MRKKILCIVLVVTLGFVLSACGQEEVADVPAQAEEEKGGITEVEESAPLSVATLYTDASYGNVDPPEGTIRQFEMEYEGDLTPEILMDGLTELTGLNFSTNNIRLEDGGYVIVDWSTDSTLLTAEQGWQSTDEFQFQDLDHLRWFMLDSVWKTLTSNSLVDGQVASYVCYTMDGGVDLIVNELYPQSMFGDADAYMGSGFYFAHADVVGDEEGMEDQTAEMVEDYVPVLSGGPGFTGTTIIETNNDYNGGYFYEDLTEDGLTTIINTGFLSSYATYSGEVEGYFYEKAAEITGYETQNFSIVEYEDYSAMLTYPAYLATWYTGLNEDTKQWDAVVFNTDTHTYFYAFGTPVDFVDQTQVDMYFNVWDKMMLM